MQKFAQHLVSGEVVYVVQWHEGEKYFTGIKMSSKDLTPQTLPTAEYDEDEEPRFSDIALSLHKKDSYAPNRARDEYYEQIVADIEDLRQPVHW